MDRARAIAALVVAATAGCNQLTRVDYEGACVPAEVQAIFDASCVRPSCHDSGAQGSVNLTPEASGNIVGGRGTSGNVIVAIGDLPGSYLAVKVLPSELEGAVSRDGDPMPPEGPLASDDLETLVGWIVGIPAETDGGCAEETTTGGEPMPAVSCATPDVNAGGNITMIQAGNEAGRIPMDIAMILDGACGCHYTNMPMIPPYTPYTGDLRMATLTDFAAAVNGTPAIDLLILRVETEGMPPAPICRTDAGDPMDPTDRETLLQWLEQGTPDGATWMP